MSATLGCGNSSYQRIFLPRKKVFFFKKDTKFKAPESSVLRPLQGSRVECGAIGQASPVFVHLRTRCFLSRAYYTGCAPVYSSEIIKKRRRADCFLFFFFSGVDGGGGGETCADHDEQGAEKIKHGRDGEIYIFTFASLGGRNVLEEGGRPRIFQGYLKNKEG